MGGCFSTNVETSFKSLSMNPPTANMNQEKDSHNVEELAMTLRPADSR